MRKTLAITAISLLVLAACSDDSDSGSDEPSGDDTPAQEQVLVFNGQGNHLDVYAADPPFDSVRLITSAADDPDEGIDMNGQLCFYEDGDTTYFVAGEDTGQPERPPGWGIFELEGSSLDDLSATQVAKLTPTYADNEPDGAENFGCAVLSDGRIVTSDIGSQELGPGTGQVMIWFPPFEGGLDGEVGAIPYCKLDTGIPTALGLAVDGDDNIYLASARAADDAPDFGVWRYPGPFPTGPTEEEGCGSTDDTEAPIVSSRVKELFIPAGEHDLATPSGLAIDADGTFVVASVFNGVINRYDADGAFVATILAPAEGEVPGPDPLPTGSPQGVGIGPDGTIYYADIAIVIREGIGPASGEGTVRRITFVDGEPQAPEIMGSGLAFPDGIGVWVLNA